MSDVEQQWLRQHVRSEDATGHGTKFMTNFISAFNVKLGAC